MSTLGGQEAGAVAEVDRHRARLGEIVRNAWAATLPEPFDLGQTWEEAGGDSLASLHLLLALEEALARKLSFDALAPDMTIDDMARSLSAPPAVRPVTETPSIFLLPGIRGDEPRLADFRRAFGDRLRFELIELPDVDCPAAVLADVEATALLAAEEIQRRQPQGDILLAGFSFGGSVAFEAAHHLRAAQRTVAWIGILDTVFDASFGWRRFLRPASLMACRIGASDRRRGVLLRLVRRYRPASLPWLRRELLKSFRKRAISRWNPQPLPVPTLLAASQPGGPARQERWRALCPDLSVVQLPGHHLALFQSPSIELLAPAFEAAALAARTDCR